MLANIMKYYQFNEIHHSCTIDGMFCGNGIIDR